MKKTLHDFLQSQRSKCITCSIRIEVDPQWGEEDPIRRIRMHYEGGGITASAIGDTLDQMAESIVTQVQARQNHETFNQKAI